MDTGTLADPGGGGSRPSTPSLADVLAVQTRRIKTVRICVDGELVDALEVLGDALATLDGDDAVEIAEQIEELAVQAAEHTFAFRMQALAPKDWSDLLAEHPPRKGKTEAFNLDTLPAAAVGACCIAPTGIDTATIEALWERLSVGDRGRLFSCAWEANTEGTSVPNSSAASALLRISGRSSTTAAPLVSLAASS